MNEVEVVGPRRGGGVRVRNAEPEDHPRVMAVVDGWWGGRPMAPMLPRLFFEHFRPTSFVAEGASDAQLLGFLCGFVSQTDPREAYIHFAGVDPDHRGQGVGRRLYHVFFAAARERGCTSVRCVTSPVNTGSVAFHRAMGFEPTLPSVAHDGPGQDRVRFRIVLD